MTLTSTALPEGKLLIGPDFVSAAEGGLRPIVNPATGEALGTVSEGGSLDVEAAVAAARKAFDESSWPAAGARDRAKLLTRVADLVERDRQQLAELETLNTGKTLTESLADTDQIADVFRYYAGLISTQQGSVNPVPADAMSLTLHEPIGVVAMITPWNYPLLQASWKVAPAVAAGCTFVLKPSELTPYTTIRLGELMLEAGLPAGVCNVVLGAGSVVGEALVTHEQVDMVSFTGGIVTGRRVAAGAADSVKRLALELGGKNPNIVFADADFEASVDHALNAVFYHAGQVCSAGSRLLVEDAWHDKFVDALVEKASHIRIGFGWEPDTEMGPLISAEHRDKVESYIKLAQEEGASILLGGGRPQGGRFRGGFFVEPTIVVGVRSEMRIAQEEIFGPVLTVERFASEGEAVRLANGTATGLAAAVWTKDVAKAMSVAKKLRFGTVWINDFHPYYPEAPWGGFKQSGVGRELGHSGLREYQEEKHLYLNLDVKSANWFARGRK